MIDFKKYKFTLNPSNDLSKIMLQRWVKSSAKRFDINNYFYNNNTWIDAASLNIVTSMLAHADLAKVKTTQETEPKSQGIMKKLLKWI